MGANYEPELLNAATFRRDRVHYTCFASGRVVVTGVKKVEETEPVLLELEMCTRARP